MPHPRALSAAQAEQAADLYREGYSQLQVAAALSVSTTAVKTALKDQGVATRTRSQALRSPKNPARYRHSKAASVWDLGRIVNRRISAAGAAQVQN